MWEVCVWLLLQQVLSEWYWDEDKERDKEHAACHRAESLWTEMKRQQSSKLRNSSSSLHFDLLPLVHVSSRDVGF